MAKQGAPPHTPLPFTPWPSEIAVRLVTEAVDYGGDQARSMLLEYIASIEARLEGTPRPEGGRPCQSTNQER